MQKVVIDTNVFVSGLIQRSYPYLIISELFLEGKIHVCISDDLLQEYYSVLSRKKFAKYPDFVAKAEILIADMAVTSCATTSTRSTTLATPPIFPDSVRLVSAWRRNWRSYRSELTIRRPSVTSIPTPPTLPVPFSISNRGG